MKESLIQNAPLFASLSPEEVTMIAGAMREMAFAKGEVLLAQGQPVTRMYLIQSGWVKQSTALEGGRTLVNNLGAGSMVGEMDSLLDQPSGSSAQTNTDVVLWAISQSDISRILDEQPRIGLKLSTALGARIRQVDQYLVSRRLRSMPLFADLESDQLTALAERLSPLEIRRGSLIYRAGAPADALFIIEEGQVMLTSAAETAGDPHSHLGPGQTLGEMSLLTGKPYDGVARAATEVVLWVLRREDYAQVVTRFPTVRATLSSRLSGPLGSEDRQSAQQLLGKLPLFADLPAEVLGAVSSVLVLRHVPAGEQIFSIGDPGDALLVIESGQLKLTNSSGGARLLNSGDQIGHSSLLTGKNRSEMAVAVSDSNLWILYRSDFDALLARHPALGISLGKAVTDYLEVSDRLFLDSHLRGMALFAGLSDAELRDIAESLHPSRVGRGDVVFAEGERGNAMYLIETGEVQLATRLGDGYQMAFERLGAGAFFGELALLADSPRKSTARAAASETQLWALYKSDFDRLAIKHPQLALTMSKMLGERMARADAVSAPPRRLQAPPSGGRRIQAASPQGALRPLKAKPSSVPPVRRPGSGPRPLQTQAIPLTLKPESKSVPGMPKARPVAARPAMSVAFRKPVPARPTASRALVPHRAAGGAMVVRKGDPLALAVYSGVNWMAARPLGFKFRLAALTMLFVWLCGIAAPVTALTALTLSNKSVPAAAFSGISVNISGEEASPLPGQLALAATFTPTPRPTATPMRIATSAPLPTETPVPQATATPRPVNRVAPPTATPTTAGPVAADVRSVPNVDFKVESVRRLTACENQGNHNFYMLVLDQNGKGIPGLDLQVVWDSGRATVKTGLKLENIPWLGVNAQTTAGYADYALFKGRYKAKVMNYVSEETEWLTVDIPVSERCDRNGNDIGNSLFHYSYLINFKKVR